MADRQEPFFSWSHTDSSALRAATLRAFPEDFGVDEQMPYTLAGASEHLWVKLRKCGYNTEQAAKQIARTAGVTRREVATKYGSGDVETHVAACEQAAVCTSRGNQMNFPFVRKAVAARSLQLHGCYFDLDHGELHGFQPETGSFELLTEGATDDLAEQTPRYRESGLSVQMEKPPANQ
jgi:hypothetical protein